MDPYRRDENKGVQATNQVPGASGRVEAGPVAVPDTQVSDVETFVKPAPHLVPPNLSGEERRAGIRYNTLQPQIPPDAISAGVSPSVPLPDYGNFPKTKSEAKHDLKTQPPNSSNRWRALTAIVNLFKKKRTVEA